MYDYRKLFLYFSIVIDVNNMSERWWKHKQERWIRERCTLKWMRNTKKSNGTTLKPMSNVIRTHNFGDTYTLVERVTKTKQGSKSLINRYKKCLPYNFFNFNLKALKIVKQRQGGKKNACLYDSGNPSFSFHPKIVH